MLSEKKIREIVEENRDYLEALEDFDRTGQLRKVRVKERVNFTVDSLVMHKFRTICEDKGIKMSSVVERLILEYINKK